MKTHLKALKLMGITILVIIGLILLCYCCYKYELFAKIVGIICTLGIVFLIYCLFYSVANGDFDSF